MASIRELMPYLVGGAVGALSPQAAQGVQSAAAWSHRLSEDKRANERRDEAQAVTARRLELAEKAEERQASEHKWRTSVSEIREKEAAEKFSRWQKDNQAIDSARAIFGERLAAIGGDPSVVGAMSVREMQAEEENLRKAEARFGSIDEARAHFEGNPLGMGQSAQVYTDQGAFSASGPRQPSVKDDAEFDGDMVDSKTRSLELKARGKIADAQDEIDELRRDLETYGEEEPEYKKAKRAILAQQRKIQGINSQLEEDVVQMMIKSNVPNKRIQSFRNRNAQVGTVPLQSSHAQNTAGSLFQQMIEEEQGQNDPRLIR